MVFNGRLRNVATLVVAALIVALGWAVETQAADLPFVRIVSTSPGGVWHTFATNLANILQDQFPNTTFVNVPGGSDRNHVLVSEGQAQVGFSFTPVTLEAYLGQGAYDKPYQNVRLIGTHYAAYLNLVTRRDANIQHISELKDKVISPGLRTWATTKVVMQILETFDITPETVEEAGGTIHYLGFPDVESMMQDRRLDGFMYYGSVPSPLLVRLNENPGIDLPPYTEEDVERILERLEPKGAFVRLEHPENPYPGVKGGYPTPAMWSIIIVHKDVPDDLVYAITKTVYEDESLREFMGGGTSVNIDYATFGLKDGPVPFHPGAIRYFEERGVW